MINYSLIHVDFKMGVTLVSVIDIRDFGARPDTGEDATLAVVRAIERCKAAERPRLVFPKGVYHFRPDQAVEKQLYIPNHDQDKNRRIAFYVSGFEGLEIDGQGSEFVFHGLITPFAIEHCRDVRLTGFSVDWERPMLSQGKVVAAGDRSFDVSLPDEYRFEVEDGRIVFEGEGWREPCHGLIEMDPITGSVAFGSGDDLNYGHYANLRVEAVSPGIVRYREANLRLPKVGNELVFQCGARDCPGIYANESADIRLDAIEIRHAIGMGVIAQRCENVGLADVRVKPKAGSGRRFSALADATHFVSCRGLITLEDCRFENQMDDPCNVHAIYAPIHEKVSSDAALIRLAHPQQRGARVLAAGERVRFVRGHSLLPYFEAAAKEVLPLNPEFALVTFDRELPEDLAVGDAVENADWVPDLVVRRCVARGNRARGFLITTGGRVLLERNVISAPGAGVKISGDANHWFESGAVRDVTIRDNDFADCNTSYPQWGKAAIDIDPEIRNPGMQAERYHAGIRIVGNRFKGCHPAIVDAIAVDGLDILDNVAERSGEYPATKADSIAVRASDCSNVMLSGNRCSADRAFGLIDSRLVSFHDFGVPV